MNESRFEFSRSEFNRRTWLKSAMMLAASPLAAVAASTRSFDEDEDENDQKFQTKIETSLIGDHTNFGGQEWVVLEGVGLVRGLSGTGGDPSPSQYRSTLLEDLKKKGYRYPNAILESPDTALVIVRAYLPPLIKKGERLDVRVTIPGSANATSLVGGELLEVRLSDRAVIDGRYMTGRVYAIARGPVLTDGLGASTASEPAMLRQGKVLSGAVVTKERELSIYLRNDFRFYRNAKRISDSIGRRFHDFDEHGIKRPLAVAKSDQQIVLKVHPRYKGNTPRFKEVIRHMAFHESPVEQRVRMSRLKHDLCIPELASSSALQLEAIGNDAIPILKHGLKAPMLECRFHAANALAYLGDSSGIPALVESAKNERAFRVFALTSLSAIEDAAAHVALRELMNESVEELRYGSFRSLWTLDRNDPFIRGEALGIRDEATNHDNEYRLHVLKTSGPSLVHVTLKTRPEIVLFGSDQEFSAPMNVAAGKHIMVVAQPGDTTATLVRLEAGKQDQRKEVSLKVADVIRAANELGATYPDVLQLLADASRQKNMPTALATDKLPETGRVYHRPGPDGKKGGARPVKIGRDHMAPDAFPAIDDPEEAARHRMEEARDQKGDTEGSMASVPSERTDGDVAKSESPSKEESRSKGNTVKPRAKTKNTWSLFGTKK